MAKKKEDKIKDGRPLLSEEYGIDFTNEEQYSTLVKYLEVGLTKIDVAHIYNVSQETLGRIIKDQLYTTFDKLYKKHSLTIKARARRNLINLSDGGDTTATIYLNKLTGAVETKDKIGLEIKREELELKKKSLEAEINWKESRTEYNDVKTEVEAMKVDKTGITDNIEYNYGGIDAEE